MTVARLPWYAREETFPILGVTLIGLGAAVASLADKWVFPTFLPFLAGIGGGFIGGLFLSKFVRDRIHVPQEIATIVFFGLVALSFAPFVLLGLEAARPAVYAFVGILQGVGVAIGFHAPWAFGMQYRDMRREELVDQLAYVAKRERFVVTSPDSISELEKIVQDNVNEPELKGLYEKDRYKVLHELWSRQRRERRGELDEITAIWERVVEVRARLRDETMRLAGFPFYPEKENLFPNLARLPTFLTELESMTLDLAEVIDDIDEEALHRLTGTVVHAGHLAVRDFLTKVNPRFDSKPVELLDSLRQVRHGFAHRPDEAFFRALRRLGLEREYAALAYSRLWIGLSSAYLRALEAFLANLHPAAPADKDLVT